MEKGNNACSYHDDVTFCPSFTEAFWAAIVETWQVAERLKLPHPYTVEMMDAHGEWIFHFQIDAAGVYQDIEVNPVLDPEQPSLPLQLTRTAADGRTCETLVFRAQPETIQ